MRGVGGWGGGGRGVGGVGGADSSPATLQVPSPKRPGEGHPTAELRWKRSVLGTLPDSCPKPPLIAYLGKDPIMR